MKKKKFNIRTLLAPAVFLLFAGALSARQNPVRENAPTVTIAYPQDTLQIGDQPELTVTVDKDVAQVVLFPDLEGEIAPDVEVLSATGIDTLKNGNRRETLTRKYRFAIFRQGEYHLGNFPVMYLDKNVTDTILSADSITFLVRTIAIDTTTQKIHPVKPPVKMPLVFAEIDRYVYWSLLGLLLLAALAYAWIRYRKHKPLLPEKPKLPPHVTAINELEHIREQNLWQSGKVKLYYSSLTDVIRRYLEERYNVNAKEMTTNEILDVMQYIIRKKGKDYEMLRDLLTLSDLVKFAKWQPTTTENQTAYDHAYYFVESTKAVPETEAEPEARKEEPQS